MIVYGHRTLPLYPGPFLGTFEQRLGALPTTPSSGTLVDLLVDFAEAESAVTDSFNLEEDDERDEAVPWREALDALTAAFVASLDGQDERAARHLADVRRRVCRLAAAVTPCVVQAKAAEGFACYALFPEQYVDAARTFIGGRSDLERSSSIVCLGLRGIGSVLSSVVMSTCRERGLTAQRRSVRPRGHPFDRHLQLGTRLQAFLAGQRSSTFVVVDEGPGISGSSFASAADALRAIGVPDDRIVLLPSWSPDPSALRSERARRAFTTHRVIVGSSPASRFGRETLLSGDQAGHRSAASENLSAGEWRSFVLPGQEQSWPAVHPQHERVKLAAVTGASAAVARFAGLGRRGSSMFVRASQLHEAGFGPEPLRFERGFVVLEWIPGIPLSPESALTTDRLTRLANYVVYLARSFALDEYDDGLDLRGMLEQNARESLPAASAAQAAVLAERWKAAPGRRVAVDGRMLPHDWIDDGEQLVKVDGLDHHSDDFLPGCRDIAWDLAGIIVEFDLDQPATRVILGRYVRGSGDIGVVERLPFFMAAYLAYRLGYATLAADTLGGTPDGARFSRLRERYRRSLAAHVEHPHLVAGH